MSHSRTVFRSSPHCIDEGIEAPEGWNTTLQATLLVGGRASVQTQGLFSNAACSAPSVNGGCLVRPHSGSAAGSSLELGIPVLPLSQSPHSPIQLPEKLRVPEERQPQCPRKTPRGQGAVSVSSLDDGKGGAREGNWATGSCRCLCCLLP